MPIEVLMPALSPTMTEGNLAKWHKKVGDSVKAGDVIAEIETDKATMEVEAVDEGIDAEVINLRTLRPLDTATIVESVKKTNRIVSVEEGWPFAGIGSEIAAQLMEHAFDWLDAPVARVCGKDVPLPYAANLERLALPQITDVVAAAKAVTYR